MTNVETQRLDVRQLVLDAEERSREYLVETPLEYSPYLSQLIDGEVWLKLEFAGPIASFKLRGALNALLAARERGDVASAVTA